MIRRGSDPAAGRSGGLLLHGILQAEHLEPADEFAAYVDGEFLGMEFQVVAGGGVVEGDG